jgi:hypothetical protein
MSGFNRAFLFFTKQILSIFYRSFKYKLPLVACIFVFTACLKDRVFPPAPIPAGSNANLKAGFIKINEIQPDFNADSGDLADWVEIYNTTDSALILEPGRFWMTDEKNQKFQYDPIRRYSIPAKSFFIVYFKNNGLDNSQTEITNIEGSLSSNGEFVGFYFLANNNDTITLDTVTFPASTSQNETYGRLPDGTGGFQKLKIITRNASNNVNTPVVVEPLDTIPYALKINEVQADFQADSGDVADWVELYNSSDAAITIKPNRFWITTDSTKKDDYTILRPYTIPAKGFLTVYFQSAGTDVSVQDVTYINGNLSKNGEFVGFSFKKKSGELVFLDKIKFPAFTRTSSPYQSYGRFPDGEAYKWLNDISRNASNNKNGVIVPPVEPYAGMFIINEIAPAETSFDWVELKSQLSVPFVMKKGRWFVSDSGTIGTRIDLNVDFTFFPNSYPVVTCSTTIPSTIDSLRATFGLNRKADMFRIEYKKDDGQFLIISQYSYKYPSDILSNKTISRKSYGTYQENTEPTKGLPNP